MRLSIRTLSVLGVLVLWGCGGGPAKPDAKGLIKARVGKLFVIDLPAPAGSKGEWVIVKDFDPKIAALEEEEIPAESDKPGAPLIKRRTYKTLAKGKAAFEAKLAEGGDVKKKVSRTLKFQLSVE